LTSYGALDVLNRVSPKTYSNSNQNPDGLGGVVGEPGIENGIHWPDVRQHDDELHSLRRNGAG
jgi:hypothetical protein